MSFIPNNNSPEQFEVAEGQLVRPIFNKFLEFLGSKMLLGGVGVLLSFGSRGVSINARSNRAVFEGSFFVRNHGTAVTVNLGLLLDGLGNAFEPQIANRPISGSDGKPQPQIKIDSKKFNKEGRSWIALQVISDKTTGAITLDNKTPLGIEVVQVASLLSTDDTIGLCPLALFQLLHDSYQLHQIAWWDAIHSTSRNPDGTLLHFFDPAS